MKRFILIHLVFACFITACAPAKKGADVENSLCKGSIKVGRWVNLSLGNADILNIDENCNASSQIVFLTFQNKPNETTDWSQQVTIWNSTNSTYYPTSPQLFGACNVFVAPYGTNEKLVVACRSPNGQIIFGQNYIR